MFQKRHSSAGHQLMFQQIYHQKIRLWDFLQPTQLDEKAGFLNNFEKGSG
jgi:hypothetical protein